MERHLLIVDDEANILRALIRTMRSEELCIHTADSAQAGLEILAKHPCGVILSDQRMPGMSGVEFLSQVRQEYPDTVRLVLSGYTELKTVMEAVNRGAIYKFLAKPWEDELLRYHVQDAFRLYELDRENKRLSEQLKHANDMLRQANTELAKSYESITRQSAVNIQALEIAHEVLEHIPIGVLGVGETSEIALINGYARALFNKPAFPLLGTTLSAILPNYDCTNGKPQTHSINATDYTIESVAMGQSSKYHGFIVLLWPMH